MKKYTFTPLWLLAVVFLWMNLGHAPDLHAQTRKSELDFELDPANNTPQGLWSDGTTMWVVDSNGKKIYAYNLATKARDKNKDFNMLNDAGNNTPQGLWSDGTTMWIGDINDTKLYAYNLATKDRDEGKDFDMLNDAGNGIPGGLWSDGTTMWIGDRFDRKLYAYNLKTKVWDERKDFNTLILAENTNPLGLWSDDRTMWVADFNDDKLYAYNLATKVRDKNKDFNTLNDAGNNNPRGLWSDATTMWVVDNTDDKIYAYDLPNKTQTITFTLSGTGAVGDTLDLSDIATASSGLEVTYSSSNTTIAEVGTGINAGKLILKAAGDATITASQEGDAQYFVATEVTHTITVSKKSQIITFTLSTGMLGDTLDLSDVATASSGLEVTYSSSDPSIAEVGTGMNEGKLILKALGRVTITASQAGDDQYFAATEVSQEVTVVRRSKQDFNTLNSTGNTRPGGLWSNGTTMWVVDDVDRKLYAYNLKTKAWHEDKDFALAAGNARPGGLWSNGTTMWVADINDTKLYAYNLKTKARDEDKDFALAEGNTNPAGLWSNNTTMWVADYSNAKLYAYNLKNKAWDEDKDFALAAGNTKPLGLWSNKTIMWVANGTDDKIYAYNLKTKARDASKYLTLAAGNTNPLGLWSNGTTMWVSDFLNGKLYAYDLPKNPQDITFTLSGTGILGDTLNLSATASSGLEVTYSSSNTTIAEVGTGMEEGKLILKAAGNATITASQEGDAQYFAATEVTHTITVSKKSQMITFNLSGTGILDNTLDLSATASSGLEVTYSSSNTTIVEVGTGINAGKLILKAAGNATITASQEGDDQYFVATEVTHTITVSKKSQMITFNLSTGVLDDTLDLSDIATASSGLEVSYVSSNSDIAEVGTGMNEGKLILKTLGRVTITASQEGDAQYFAATEVTHTITVSKKSQMIIFNLSTGVLGDTLDLSDIATASSMLEVSYVSSNSDIAEVGTRMNEGKLILKTLGRVTITASQAGDDQYFAATEVSQEVTVVRRSSKQDFKTLNSTGNTRPGGLWSNGTTMWVVDDVDRKLYAYNLKTKAWHEDKDFALAAGNARPGGLWSNGTTMWVADINDTKLYAYNLKTKARDEDKDFALAEGNTNPAGLWSNNTTMWVADYSNAKLYAYNLKNKAWDEDKDFALAAGNTNPLGLWSNKTIMWVANGTDDKLYAYNLKTKARDASKYLTLAAGNTRPGGIWSNGTTMWVSDFLNGKLYAYDLPKNPQDITFTLSGTGIWGDTLNLSATASSGLEVTYSSSNTTIAEVGTGMEEGKLILKAAGNATITASQEGDAQYFAATEVTHTITVSKKSQMITFNLSGTGILDNTLDLSATASSGLEVTYSSSNTTIVEVGTGINAGKLILKAAGNATITASQEGDDQYFVATEVTHTITVSKKSQMITFNLSTGVLDDTLDLSDIATASSGLEVSYVSSNSDIAEVGTGMNEGKLILKTLGRVTITASQEGDAQYFAATEVTHTITVSKKSQMIIFNLSTGVLGDTLDLSDIATASSMLEVSYVSSNSDIAEVGTRMNEGKLILKTLGRVTITASQAGDDQYFAATEVSQEVTVVRRSSKQDFKTLNSTGNTRPGGLWSNGTTMWVVDDVDRKLYAYNLKTKAWHEDKDFALAAGNARPGGLWSNGTTMWVADINDTKLYAYNLKTKARDEDKDFALAEGNTNPAGLWSNNTTMWVADYSNAKLYAYNLKNKAWDEDKDFALAAGNTKPLGLWSNKTIMWVANGTDDKLYAYNLKTKARDASKYLTLAAGNTNPLGLWSNGTTMWVSDFLNGKLYAYDLPKNPQDITFTLSGTGILGDTLNLSATASSGLEVTYSSSDPSIAEVNAGKLIFKTLGDATITASQEGDAQYFKATEVTQEVTVVRRSKQDFKTLTGNTKPAGIWSNNTTMWVADINDTKLYAYNLKTKARDSDKDFALATGNANPAGLWSNNTTMWVADYSGAKLYAYNLKTKAWDEDKDFALAAGNTNPLGLWSNNTTMWVADYNGAKIYAYNLKTKARDSDKDFALAAGNTNPAGLWSNKTIMWVANGTDDKLYAYNLKTKAQDASKYLTLAAGNTRPGGLWSNGTTMWVSDFLNGKLYAYDLPKNPQDITFTLFGTGIWGDTLNLSATASSGLEVTYSSSNTTIAEVGTETNTGKLILKAAGNTTITASQEGDAQYFAATEVTHTITVSKKSQMITFNLSGTGILDDTLDLSATASSGLEVTYSSSDPSIAEVNAGKLIFKTLGDATITASQEGDAQYFAATEVSQEVTVVRHSKQDFNTLKAAENTNPHGLWSDGTIMWVADFSDDKLYAYNLATKARDSTQDFNTLNDAGNNDPYHIWSNGTIMWVTDLNDDKLYAYNLATKARDSIQDFNTLKIAGNNNPRGLWSDHTTMWVMDARDAKIYAYNLATKVRDKTKDFNTLIPAENTSPSGLWSDDRTMWVTDFLNGKLYAYNLATKTRDENKDFNTLIVAGNNDPRGLWSDHTTMWVTDARDAKIYAYDLPNKTQNITFNLSGTGVVGDTLDLSATASSTLEVTYSSSNTTIAEVGTGMNTGKLILKAAGNATITASQAGDDEYFVAPDVSQDITVSKKPQTIENFTSSLSGTVGDTLDLSATTSSTLKVTYVSSDPSIAEVNTGKLILKAGGDAMITASQVGNTEYFVAMAVTQSITVSKKPQTIENFTSSLSGTVGDTLDLSDIATASSMLEVTYSSSDPSIAEVNTGKLILKAAGNATITASQEGNDQYLETTEVSHTITVSKKDQAITFTLSGTGAVGDTLDLSATASSMLEVTYSSSDPSIAEVNTGKLILKAAGNATITASQEGNAQYLEATEVSHTITVSKKDQAITFTLPGTGAVGDTLNLSATASSTLEVTYSSSDHSIAEVGTGVNAGKLILRDTGTVIITASQEGNAQYLEATEVSHTITVSKKDQAITFTLPGTGAVGDTLNLSATASSTLEVTYSSSDHSIAEVNTGKLILKAAGNATITASQAGNDRYLAAPDVTHTITVSKKSQMITFNLSTGILGDTLDLSDIATASSTLEVTYSSSDHSIAEVGTGVNAGKLILRDTGTVIITASQAGNDRYLAAPDVTHTITVSKKSQMITFNLSTGILGDTLDLSDIATASSMLEVTYVSSNSDIAEVGTGMNEGKLILKTLGRVTITASQAGNDRYLAATGVTHTITVSKKDQTITFTLPSTGVMDDTLDLSATASSGLEVTYSSSDPSIAEVGTGVNTGKLILKALGDIMITASQEGNDQYLAATKVSQEVTVVRHSEQDFNTLKAAENTASTGLWSDDTTMWVGDKLDGKIYAYNLATKARDENKDLTLATGNIHPFGLWSNGTTMWVGDFNDAKIYAYNLKTKDREASKDFETRNTSENAFPSGIWSDHTTMWVADYINGKIYAYNLKTKTRDVGKDFNTLNDAGNINPLGLWSNDITMWVTNFSDAKIYAYNLKTKDRDASKDFNTLKAVGNNSPYGLWSNDTTMWVGDFNDAKIYAYALPNKTQTITFTLSGAGVVGDTLDLSATASSMLEVSCVSSDPSIAEVGTGINAGKLILKAVGNATITASQVGNARYLAATDVSQSVAVSEEALSPDVKNTDIRVWPNPVATQLNISSGSRGKLSITLHNLTGQRLQEEEFKGEGQMDLALVPAGVYLLHIRTAEEATSYLIHKE